MRSPRVRPRPRLLIVDDDETLAFKMAQLFRMEGYEVSVATDGFHALRFIDAGVSPNVILLDMHMAGINGWDVASELEALRQTIPIVVITGDPDPADCAEQVGAAGWLAKPVGANELIGAVEAAILSQA